MILPDVNRPLDGRIELDAMEPWVWRYLSPQLSGQKHLGSATNVLAEFFRFSSACKYAVSASRVEVIKPFTAPTALQVLAPWNVTGAELISLYSVCGSSPLDVRARGAVKTTLALSMACNGSSLCFSYITGWTPPMMTSSPLALVSLSNSESSTTLSHNHVPFFSCFCLSSCNADCPALLFPFWTVSRYRFIDETKSWQWFVLSGSMTIDNFTRSSDSLCFAPLFQATSSFCSFRPDLFQVEPP